MQASIATILRRVLIVLALAGGVALSLGSAPALAQTTPGVPADPNRAAVVQSFFAAMSSGDLDTALAAFTDNAVYIGPRPTGACAQLTPCAGAATIRPELERQLAGGHVCQTLLSVEVVGSVVMGQLDFRSDALR